MELHHMDLELELAKLLGPPLYPHLDLLPTPVLVQTRDSTADGGSMGSGTQIGLYGGSTI